MVSNRVRGNYFQSGYDHPEMTTFMLLIELAGTFVFALSGATAGVRKQLDLFGVLVLSIVSANFGGIARDVLIGAIPPVALQDMKYMGVSVAAGVMTFYWYPIINRLGSPVLLFDAVGLALFAVAGAQKALSFGLDPVMAALLGMVTGIGGGMARDILLAQVPTVLRSELYAIAALAGAGMVVVGSVLDFPPTVANIAGIAVCFGLRLMAIKHGWRLPVAFHSEPTEFDSNRKD